jgi:hypothetical protein
MKPLLLKIHVNPPAEVSTSLKVYQGHTLEKTYMGEDFFWAITPTAGDYILFKFDKPVHVERLVTVDTYLILDFIFDVVYDRMVLCVTDVKKTVVLTVLGYELHLIQQINKNEHVFRCGVTFASPSRAARITGVSHWCLA